MPEVELHAEHRPESGKGPARRLRAAGKVPATMYGGDGEAMSLAVDARALSAALTTGAGVNALLDIHVDGDTHLAMARELERDPLRGSIIHVDFLRIDRTKTIAVDVPVHLEGASPGIKEGGVLEHHLWQLHLSCLPGSVPDRIDVDISTLQIGDAIRVGDIAAPDGVTVLTAAEEIIVTVVVPQVLEVEPTAEEEEALLAEGEEAPEGEAAEGEGAEDAGEAGGDES